MVEPVEIMSVEFLYLVAASFLVYSILRFFYVRHEIQVKERERLVDKQEREIEKLDAKIEQHNKHQEKIKMIEKELNDDKVFNCPNCGAKGQVGICEFCGTRG